MGTAAGPRRRRVWPTPQLLLQRAQRFFRGDREVPSGAEDLVPADEGPLRREERPHATDALPYADRGGFTDGTAADEQYRAGRNPSAGRGAGRNTVAAHRRARRSAGATDSR